MQWVFAGFYKVFGDHVMISRILTFIIGLFSVYGFYYLLKNIFHNTLTASIGAWCFNFSPLFYYYTVNPLPDNFALCCAIWGTAFFFKWKNDNRIFSFILFACFLSLSSLAKLPFIIYSTFFGTYILLDLKNNKFKNLSKNLLLIFIFLAILIPALSWYIIVVPSWQGNGIVKGILDSNMTSEEIFEIIYGTVVSKLPELILNFGSVLFFLAGFYFLFRNKKYMKDSFLMFFLWGMCLIMYFIFEMNMITLVHDYYLFPFFPAIFMIVSYGAYYLYINPKPFYKYIVVTLLCILPLTAYLRSQSRWNTIDPGFNVNYYNYKNELRALIPENAYCIVGNDLSHFILLYYIDKKGWAFHDDNLTGEMIQYYMSKGAKYLFIDSGIDQREDIKKHLSKKIFEKGNLRVYQLE